MTAHHAQPRRVTGPREKKMLLLLLDIFDVGTVLFLVCAVVLAVWIVLYVNLRRSMQAEIAELRAMVYSHVRAHETPAAAKPAEAKPAAEPLKPAAPIAAAAPTAAPVVDKEELTSETLAIISAAVAAYLGKTVRLRQARLLPTHGASPWAQQGRVYIQASHNLAFRAHG